MFAIKLDEDNYYKIDSDSSNIVNISYNNNNISQLIISKGSQLKTVNIIRVNGKISNVTTTIEEI